MDLFGTAFEAKSHAKGIDKHFATGYDELAWGVEAIGNLNNKWHIRGCHAGDTQ